MQDYAMDRHDTGDTEIQEIRSLVERLAELDLMRGASRGMTREIEMLEVPFRKWLDAHPGQKIEDPEHDPPLIAEIVEQQGHGYRYDPPNAMAEANPQAYARLIALGCLAEPTWDEGRIEDAIKNGQLSAGDIGRWQKPGRSYFHAGPRRKGT